MTSIKHTIYLEGVVPDHEEDCLEAPEFRLEWDEDSDCAYFHIRNRSARVTAGASAHDISRSPISLTHAGSTGTALSFTHPQVETISISSPHGGGIECCMGMGMDELVEVANRILDMVCRMRDAEDTENSVQF